VSFAGIYIDAGCVAVVEEEVSYAGYLTVNKKYNSNLFFWFFPAKLDQVKAPVVLWLQGGPGASSLFGLFQENGPFFRHFKKVS